MNYLGHALLSFHQPEILAGNMIGDYMKGLRILETLPVGIKNGVLLHRKIDAYADAHPALLRAKNLFRPDYRLYSGAVVDSLLDHFLANDPRYFPSEVHLYDFTQGVYRQLENYRLFLPESFQVLMPYMASENWLYNYRHLKGMQSALQGLVRRARYMNNSDRAYELLVTHYYELNQHYFDFIDDVVLYVKNELNKIAPGY